VLISSYLPEVLALGDRILVARGGRIVTELLGSDATEEAILFAAVH
jgi:ABC-type sugar transport system ATPase subunit